MELEVGSPGVGGGRSRGRRRVSDGGTPPARRTYGYAAHGDGLAPGFAAHHS